MVALKAEDGSIITNRRIIVERCVEFYGKLYGSKVNRPPALTTAIDSIPPVKNLEVDYAVKHMKNNKAPGPDGILIDLIKEWEMS